MKGPLTRTESPRTPSATARQGTPSNTFGLPTPHGLLTPRVQVVGPEHVGIVCLDGAKARALLPRRLLRPRPARTGHRRSAGKDPRWIRVKVAQPIPTFNGRFTVTSASPHDAHRLVPIC